MHVFTAPSDDTNDSVYDILYRGPNNIGDVCWECVGLREEKDIRYSYDRNIITHIRKKEWAEKTQRMRSDGSAKPDFNTGRAPRLV